MSRSNNYNFARDIEFLVNSLAQMAPIGVSMEEVRANFLEGFFKELPIAEETRRRDPAELLRQIAEFEDGSQQTQEQEEPKPTADILFSAIKAFGEAHGLYAQIRANDGRQPESSFDCDRIVALIERADLEVLNAQDQYGWTPLHSAIHFQSLRMTEALVKRGVDLEIKNRRDETPLFSGMEFVTNWQWAERSATRAVEYLLYQTNASREVLSGEQIKKLIELEAHDWKSPAQVVEEERLEQERHKQELKATERGKALDKIKLFISNCVPVPALARPAAQLPKIAEVMLETMVLDREITPEFRARFSSLTCRVLEKICAEYPVVERIFYLQAHVVQKEISTEANIISLIMSRPNLLRNFDFNGIAGFYVPGENFTVSTFESEEDFEKQAAAYLEGKGPVPGLLVVFAHETLHHFLDRYFSNDSAIYGPIQEGEAAYSKAREILVAFKKDFQIAREYVEAHPHNKEAKKVLNRVVNFFEKDEKITKDSHWRRSGLYLVEDMPVEVPAVYVSALLEAGEGGGILLSEMFPHATRILYWTLDIITRDYNERFPSSETLRAHQGDLVTPEESMINELIRHTIFSGVSDQAANGRPAPAAAASSNEEERPSVICRRTKKKKSGLATGWWGKYSAAEEKGRKAKKKTTPAETRGQQPNP